MNIQRMKKKEYRKLKKEKSNIAQNFISRRGQHFNINVKLVTFYSENYLLAVTLVPFFLHKCHFLFGKSFLAVKVTLVLFFLTYRVSFFTGAPLKVVSVFRQVKCFKLLNWCPPIISKCQLVPPKKVLSVRLHSKSHQKSPKCQNLLTD